MANGITFGEQFGKDFQFPDNPPIMSDERFPTPELQQNQEKMLEKGRWRLSFDTTYVPTALLPDPKKLGYSITVLGKEIELEEIARDDSKNELYVTINIFENPLPIVAITASIGVIGIIGILTFIAATPLVEALPEALKSAGFLVAIGTIAFLIFSTYS